ncbi:exodeoxyribonuclease X [Klebsiella pneumoniae]|uniref:exodeoxyribonuclease X n=1 Tax=Klebsiella pneumoniae TaxID=573 RepID=UPI00298D9126|nr:exodeoxyribonuclease X [Klebsiella pneumoniae]MDW7137873.1 exodeoxyribonuclease X [Klebsiella pneumoniae]MDW7160805.1 exodeoxyribonuclease X [Klebsiella pneumoniae]MDW7400249.1 exodeoxyribonuclease X [Klebsiella pneumoniae]MDX4476798.1 exodeoxyribonuclease X [Klebsiella pneumoniae]MEC6322507.1 exodeoxyribonuclease X [Klebsiella pneumoniae]
MLRVIDTETTSFEGGIVEIASVDIESGAICNPMSDFVRPPEAIGFEAMAIHHITEDMVADAPFISEVIGRYLGASVYVAHNAAFDKGKLPQIDAPWICTLKLARKLYPEFESHGNQYLRYRLGLKPTLPEGLYAHRALYDCYVTAELLMYMGREAQWTIREMREISASPSLLYRMRFGKHKGKTFEEVATEDKGYLRWLLGTDLDEDMEFTVKHWLKGA